MIIVKAYMRSTDYTNFRLQNKQNRPKSSRYIFITTLVLRRICRKIVVNKITCDSKGVGPIRINCFGNRTSHILYQKLENCYSKLVRAYIKINIKHIVRAGQRTHIVTRNGTGTKKNLANVEHSMELI